MLFPFDALKGDFDATAYFYNPNIHPADEYERRLDVLRGQCRREEIALIIGDYEPEDYFRAVASEQEKPERCRRCYSLRLGQTASFAAANGYEVFGSTLAVSPHQDQGLLRSAGQAAGAAERIPFLVRDFREGYSWATAKSRELGMYRQRYCGCVYSERERRQ